jgi:hypothetical protein
MTGAAAFSQPRLFYAGKNIIDVHDRIFRGAWIGGTGWQ